MEVREKLTRDSVEWHDTFNAAVTGICSQAPLLLQAFSPEVALAIASTSACIADAMVVLTNRLNPESPMEELTEELDKSVEPGLID